MQQTKHGSNQGAKLSNRTATEDKATNAFRSAGTCVLKDVKEHASLPINMAMCPKFPSEIETLHPLQVSYAGQWDRDQSPLFAEDRTPRVAMALLLMAYGDQLLGMSLFLSCPEG